MSPTTELKIYFFKSKKGFLDLKWKFFRHVTSRLERLAPTDIIRLVPAHTVQFIHSLFRPVCFYQTTRKRPCSFSLVGVCEPVCTWSTSFHRLSRAPIIWFESTVSASIVTDCWFPVHWPVPQFKCRWVPWLACYSYYARHLFVN